MPRHENFWNDRTTYQPTSSCDSFGAARIEFGRGCRSIGGRSPDGTSLEAGVPSQLPCRLHSVCDEIVGLHGPKARTSGAGTERTGHSTLDRTRLAADQKKAAQLQAWLAFVDETGVFLSPVVRRTWAPQGETP